MATSESVEKGPEAKPRYSTYYILHIHSTTEITNIGGFKYEISFDLGAHFNNHLNVEAEFKYDGTAAPAVVQAQLCDPAPATTEAITTGSATTPAVTSPGETTAAPTTPVLTTPVVTTPLPDNCSDISNLIQIKDKWQCRACSRARVYSTLQSGIHKYSHTSDRNKFN